MTMIDTAPSRRSVLAGPEPSCKFFSRTASGRFPLDTVAGDVRESPRQVPWAFGFAGLGISGRIPHVRAAPTGSCS